MSAQFDLDDAMAGDGTLRLALAGDWTLGLGIPAPDRVLAEIGRSPRPRKVILDAGRLARWDSGLPTFLVAVLSRCEATVTEIDGAGYDALVAAMQRTLVRFGQEMADAIVATTQVANAPPPRLE
jgi:hypothetical protein